MPAAALLGDGWFLMSCVWRSMLPSPGRRVILLAGEAGMGKTALAADAAAYARGRGAHAAWGTCWDGEGEQMRPLASQFAVVAAAVFTTGARRAAGRHAGRGA
jgi:ATP/maltotriose-dependent transcriptional regulator MalT